jgi:diguanylate cyclase (GGDEF)-like protein
MSRLKTFRIGGGIRSRIIALALISSIPFVVYCLTEVRAARMAAALVPVIATGLLIIISAWVAGEIFFLAPMRSLRMATKKLANGDLAARAELPRSSREFRELAECFNTMADRLARLATIDGLTGVANRRRFEQYLEDEWRRAVRSNTPLALALVDVDSFKLFNDTHGHQAGDDCLRVVARELGRFVHRSEDLLARYGGEEFVLGMPGLSEAEAYKHCERIRLAIAGLNLAELGPAAGTITVSLGVAIMVPSPGSASEELVAMADEALYQAKRSGRNRVVLYRDGPIPSTMQVA